MKNNPTRRALRNEYPTALANAMTARRLHVTKGGTIFLGAYKFWLDRARSIGAARRSKI